MSVFVDIDPSLSLDDTLTFLRQQEKLFLEVKGIVAASEQGKSFNLVEVDNKSGPDLPELNFRILPEGPPTIDDLAEDGEVIVDYSDIFVGGPTTKSIILYRRDPNHVPRAGVKVIKGTISTFGGPTDKGVSPNEGLALINPKNFQEFSKFFLPAQPPGTTGLARRLNNTGSHYIACRWNYNETPPHFLRANPIRVSLGTKAFDAQAVDWGPNLSTGRAADLSDMLANDLGAATDVQTVTIEIPLPGAAPMPAATGADIVAAGAPGKAPKVFSEAETKSVFGSFTFHDDPDNRGEIIIHPPWESQNIVTVHIPALVGKRIGSRRFSGDVRIHRKVASFLVAAFAEIEASNLAKEILSFAGSFVPRHILFKPNKPLSTHSWGIAFDINEDENGFGEAPPAKGATGSVRNLVPIFEKFGFFWGGKFSTPDGMHFQFGIEV